MKYHFWYSLTMHLFGQSEYKDSGNWKCKIAGFESEYTHCHPSYESNGGSGRSDTIYLGYGEITQIGDRK